MSIIACILVMIFVCFFASKRITITPHAKDRMNQRGIKEETVLRACEKAEREGKGGKGQRDRIVIPDYTDDSPDKVRAVFTVIADNKVETVYEREWEPDPKSASIVYSGPIVMWIKFIQGVCLPLLLGMWVFITIGADSLPMWANLLASILTVMLARFIFEKLNGAQK